MVNALDRPEKAQYHLVQFIGDDPSLPLFFTNWDSHVGEFLSHPDMVLDVPANVGTFGEGLMKITMKIDSLTSAMLDPMSRGTVFAPTFVVVQEIIEPSRIGDSGSTRTVFRGQVFRTRRNTKKQDDLVSIEVKNDKALMDVKLGFQINAHCVWRLNGVGCNEATHSPSGYATFSGLPITTIDGKVITVTDAGNLLDLAGSRSWTRGFIKKNGAVIGIQFYDKTQDGSSPKTFKLIKSPPVEWLTGNVQFFPGCTKQIDGDGGCRDAWDNEEGNGSAGYAIPAYNPISENPQ